MPDIDDPFAVTTLPCSDRVRDDVPGPRRQPGTRPPGARRKIHGWPTPGRLRRACRLVGSSGSDSG